MSLFDIIALVILGLSMVVGFARGALREVAAAVAFVLATIIAIFTLRLTLPLVRATLHPAWAATGVALVIVFLGAYIGLRVLAANLMRHIHSIQALGTIDRVAGSGIGLVRGLVVLGVFYIAFNLVPPPNGTPAWIANAKLYPVARASAGALSVLAPKGAAFAKQLTPALANAVKSASDESDGGQSGQNSYDDQAKDGLGQAARNLQ